MVYNGLKELLIQDGVLIPNKTAVSRYRWHFIITDKRHTETLVNKGLVTRADKRLRSTDTEELPRLAAMCPTLHINSCDENVLVPFLVAHAARLALEQCLQVREQSAQTVYLEKKLEAIRRKHSKKNG